MDAGCAAARVPAQIAASAPGNPATQFGPAPAESPTAAPRHAAPGDCRSHRVATVAQVGARGPEAVLRQAELAADARIEQIGKMRAGGNPKPRVQSHA